MRQLIAGCLLAALAGCTGNPRTEPARLQGKAAVGEPVADFRLRDLMDDAGAPVALSQFRGRPVVLFFVSPACQITWKYETRVGKLLADYQGRDVAFLGLRSSASDTDDATRKYAEAKNFDMPILADEGNAVADYFGVLHTPHFAVIDRDGVLRYHGALDDHANEKKASRQLLRQAIDAVAAGRPVDVAHYPGFG